MLPELTERLPLIDHATDWSEVSEEQVAAWKAPFGPAEVWGTVEVRDRDIPGPHGRVPVRVYTPATGTETRTETATEAGTEAGTETGTEAQAGGRPALLWLHGGAFMWGDLDMPEAHDVALGVAGRSGAVVVSAFYRLCDEPPSWGGRPATTNPDGETGLHAPVPLDDVMAVLHWMHESAVDLAIDPHRIAVGGASAGGTLAGAAALRAHREGVPTAACFPLYPAMHFQLPEPTPEEARALEQIPPVLRMTDEAHADMMRNYVGGDLGGDLGGDRSGDLGGGRGGDLGGDRAGVGPEHFPALAGTDLLATLPPTYLEVDEYDSLRPSGARFAAQLAGAGVPVELVLREGVFHGHLNERGLGAAADTMDALAERLAQL